MTVASQNARGPCLSLIVAMDRNRLIGADNGLPWHLPADLKHFRRLTMGKPMIMGRLTAESIGRALPGRENIVITRAPEKFAIPGMTAVGDLEAALSLCAACDEVMLIGGASLYEQTLALAERLYLTRIEASFDGDTYFPELIDADWRLVGNEAHQADADNRYDYVFETWQRR